MLIGVCQVNLGPWHCGGREVFFRAPFQLQELENRSAWGSLGGS